MNTASNIVIAKCLYVNKEIKLVCCKMDFIRSYKPTTDIAMIRRSRF